MTTEKGEELQLIDGIRSGDSAVIQSIYRRFHPGIVHLVEGLYGSPEDGHDVFQEGLVVVFQKVQSPDFTLTSSFYTYFYAICRNIWLSKLRKKSNLKVTFDDGILSTLKEDELPEIEQNEQYFLYRKMFLRLGQDCQKVLRLFLRKVSMEKIMAQMGYGSVSYTKKRKFLCKKKLTEMIQNAPIYRELKE